MRKSRRQFQAVSAGLLLLVSALAVVLLNGPRDRAVSTLQEQLQFMYAAPGAIPTVGVALPASPTMMRAAGAVASARAAVGTAYLRRAFPTMPGIQAGVTLMSAPPTLPAVAYGGMPIGGVVSPAASMVGGVVSPGAPMVGMRPPMAAYHVTIPTTIVGMPGVPAFLPARFGAGPFLGASPYLGAPVGGVMPGPAAMMPVARVPTAQDMAVNTAIGAAEKAAMSAGSQQVQSAFNLAQPHFELAAPPQPAMPQRAQSMPPGFVTVESSVQNAVVSPALSSPALSAAPGVSRLVAVSPGGIEQMKIVAGPGKGHIVDVTSAGKIVGGTSQQPLVSTSVSAPSVVAAGMAPPYFRRSGSEQATESAGTAAQAAQTAQSAWSLTSQSTEAGDVAAAPGGGEDQGDVAAAAQAAATGEDDANDVGDAALRAGAEEGDSAKSEEPVSEEANGQGSQLAASKAVPHRTVQLNLSARSPAAGESGATSDSEDRGEGPRGGRGEREREFSARRAGDDVDAAREFDNEVHASGRSPEGLVKVPDGKHPGDFFSAEVAGRGLMLIEVPDGVRGGDELQLLQMPADNGEDLEWVKYDPRRSLAEEREEVSRAFPRRHAGPDQEAVDKVAASRDDVSRAWNWGNQAPRSYFH